MALRSGTRVRQGMSIHQVFGNIKCLGASTTILACTTSSEAIWFSGRSSSRTQARHRGSSRYAVKPTANMYVSRGIVFYGHLHGATIVCPKAVRPRVWEHPSYLPTTSDHDRAAAALTSVYDLNSLTEFIKRTSPLRGT